MADERRLSDLFSPSQLAAHDQMSAGCRRGVDALIADIHHNRRERALGQDDELAVLVDVIEDGATRTFEPDGGCSKESAVIAGLSRMLAIAVQRIADAESDRD